MSASRAVRAASVLGLGAVLAIVFTYPIAFQLDRAGRLDTGDGHWSIWCVTWVAHALTTDPTSLFDANIFHPHRRTLAYSENNIVGGVLGLPAYLATGNALATHNTALLASFLLAFLGAYLLVRHLTGDTGVAVVAGIAYAYCPFIFARIAHVQLLMTFGLPLAMLAAHRLVERPTMGRALALSGALVVQALACGYYGIFAGLLVGLALLVFAVTRGLWRSSAYWRLVAFAAVCTIVPIVPFFLPYVEVQRELGFTRTIADAAMYSADGAAWLASAAWAHRWLHPILGTWNEVLFPGFLTTALGVAGAVVVLRSPGQAVGEPTAERAPGEHRENIGRSPGEHRENIGRQKLAAGRGQQRGQRDVALFYVMGAVLAFWISFGPAAGLYSVFFHTIPVFSLLRAPGRIGIVVTLALVVLMAMGLARVLRGRSARARLAVTAALGVVMAAELVTMPLYMRKAEPPNVAYRLLARLRPGPVVELPFFEQRSDFPRHAWYMTNSTYHWQPLINGYSDHIPQDFRRIARPLSSFPTRESFRILRERQARYVVFHLNWYDIRSREKLKDRLEQYGQYLAPLSRENDVWLFEIVGWPPTE